MSLDKILNLVPVQKPPKVSPIVGRRQRLIARIDRQMAVIQAQKAGATAPKVGDSQKRVSPWYWLDETGAYFLAVQYGKQPLELGKGKFAVQCETIQAVEDALVAIREALIKGDFDATLTRAAKAIREKFHKA
jgi:hypothetical protein